jgi:hypothetical protein
LGAARNVLINKTLHQQSDEDKEKKSWRRIQSKILFITLTCLIESYIMVLIPLMAIACFKLGFKALLSLLPGTILLLLSSVLKHKEYLSIDSVIVLWRDAVKRPGNVIKPLIIRLIAYLCLFFAFQLTLYDFKFC